MTTVTSSRHVLVLASLLAGACDPAVEPFAPTVPVSAAQPSVASASALTTSGRATATGDAPARPPDQRLDRAYPGAREVHFWTNGHAHSVELATVDPPEKVRDYYRRYAAQQGSGIKVTENADQLELDGSAAMGLMTIRRAPTNPPDARLKPGEQTVISSSRP